MRTLRLAGYALAVLVVAAPLRFGAVEGAFSASLAAAVIGVGAIWVIWRARQGMSVLPWREPVLIAAGLLILVALVQMAPLPQSALEAITPGAQAIRAEYSTPAAWATISLDPWTSRQATLRLIAFSLAALVTIDLAASFGMRRLLAGALVAGGAIQAVYGLAEFFSGRQHIFGYVKKYYTDVATGTFINRNHFAGYLEMTLPFAIAMGAGILSKNRHAPGTSFARKMASASGQDLFRAVMFLLLALIMATALLSSRSRMGMASAGVALLAMGLAVFLRGKGKIFGVAAAVVGCATLILFLQGSGAAIVERFTTVAEEFHSGLGRWTMWTQAAGMLATLPVLGSGLGTFTGVFPLFRTTGEGLALAHAHNDYVEWAAETGFVGCAALLLAAFIVLRPLLTSSQERRGYRYIGLAAAAGVLAIGFHSLTDFNLAIPSNALTAAVVLGLLVAWKRPAAARLAVDKRRGSRWIARASAPAACLMVLAVLAILPIAAQTDGPDRAATGPASMEAGLSPRADRPFMRRAIEALDADDAARLSDLASKTGRAALDDLKALIDRASLGDEPSSTAIHFVEERLGRAIEIQEAALRFQPTSSDSHLELGALRAGVCSVASLRGESPPDCVESVMEEFQAAVDLNPMGAATHARAARFLVGAWPVLDEGARARALDIIDRAASMNARDGDLKAAASFLRGTSS